MLCVSVWYLIEMCRGFACLRGYLPDGTPMNRAGNAINHPETIGPDPHTPGSPLPRALFCNSVGYLPDGTAMNAAGNAMNHPETMQPDMHTPGSPLPKSHYYADVGYLVDGTDMATAGNLSVQGGAPAPSMPASVAAPTPVAAPAPVSSPSAVSGDVLNGIKFKYAIQKDAHADLEFLNDVGVLACLGRVRPDGQGPCAALLGFLSTVGFSSLCIINSMHVFTFHCAYDLHRFNRPGEKM